MSTYCGSIKVFVVLAYCTSVKETTGIEQSVTLTERTRPVSLRRNEQACFRPVSLRRNEQACFRPVSLRRNEQACFRANLFQTCQPAEERTSLFQTLAMYPSACRRTSCFFIMLVHHEPGITLQVPMYNALTLCFMYSIVCMNSYLGDCLRQPHNV